MPVKEPLKEPIKEPALKLTAGNILAYRIQGSSGLGFTWGSGISC